MRPSRFYYAVVFVALALAVAGCNVDPKPPAPQDPVDTGISLDIMPNTIDDGIGTFNVACGGDFVPGPSAPNVLHNYYDYTGADANILFTEGQLRCAGQNGFPASEQVYYDYPALSSRLKVYDTALNGERWLTNSEVRDVLVAANADWISTASTYRYALVAGPAGNVGVATSVNSSVWIEPNPQFLGGALTGMQAARLASAERFWIPTSTGTKQTLQLRIYGLVEYEYDGPDAVSEAEIYANFSPMQVTVQGVAPNRKWRVNLWFSPSDAHLPNPATSTIGFNPANPATANYSLHTVVAHEFGHAYGLFGYDRTTNLHVHAPDSPGAPQYLMSPNVPSGQKKRSPTSSECAAAAFVASSVALTGLPECDSM